MKGLITMMGKKLIIDGGDYDIKLEKVYDIAETS